MIQRVARTSRGGPQCSVGSERQFDDVSRQAGERRDQRVRAGERVVSREPSRRVGEFDIEDVTGDRVAGVGGGRVGTRADGGGGSGRDIDRGNIEWCRIGRGVDGGHPRVESPLEHARRVSRAVAAPDDGEIGVRRDDRRGELLVVGRGPGDAKLDILHDARRVVPLSVDAVLIAVRRGVGPSDQEVAGRITGDR